MAGRIQIKNPTNQKLLTNVAVVRMKRNGKRFEIACYRNKVLSWRSKAEKDIDEVLQIHTVFNNVSKGQVAKSTDLTAAFGTDNHADVCKIILDKGELQVSDKERQHQQEATEKEVATKIADMCVNPETRLPYPVTVIEKALKDIHFALKPNRNAKQMALEAVPKLMECMPIERAKMRIRVTVPLSCKGVREKLLPLIASVEAENFTQDDYDVVGLIEPGEYRRIDELVRSESRGRASVELLELRADSDPL